MSITEKHCSVKDCQNKHLAKVGGKYLGSYLTKKEAAMAYDKGATAKWGEYAKTNFGD